MRLQGLGDYRRGDKLSAECWAILGTAWAISDRRWVILRTVWAISDRRWAIIAENAIQFLCSLTAF
ncbi:MAG: hypothetical protein FWG00_05500 [Coriobacteriia bacterium]|nr:hypothetical protein [Coriobacteriia bacterium]